MTTAERIEQLRKSLAETVWSIDWHRQHLGKSLSDRIMFESEIRRLEAVLFQEEQDNAIK